MCEKAAMLVSPPPFFHSTGSWHHSPRPQNKLKECQSFCKPFGMSLLGVCSLWEWLVLAVLLLPVLTGSLLLARQDNAVIVLWNWNSLVKIPLNPGHTCVGRRDISSKNGAALPNRLCKVTLSGSVLEVVKKAVPFLMQVEAGSRPLSHYCAIVI